MHGKTSLTATTPSWLQQRSSSSASNLMWSLIIIIKYLLRSGRVERSHDLWCAYWVLLVDRLLPVFSVQWCNTRPLAYHCFTMESHGFWWVTPCSIPIIVKININWGIYDVGYSVKDRLVKNWRGITYSPLLNGWEEFIRKYEWDEVEVTYYSINRKWWIYVRLGVWNKASHPSYTPAEIWSAALADKLVIPRLRITALPNQLASDIGSMGVNVRCQLIWQCSDSQPWNN